MLWLTNVNPTFNKGTLKKCWDLEWEVGRGGGGDDVEKVGRTSGKILATPLRVSFRNGEQRLFFVPEGSVITHRTSFELLSKILRNLCESDRINWVPRQWMEVAIFGWRFCGSFSIHFNEMRALLLVAVWCLQKDVNVFSTKGNVSRKSDLKNIPAAVTCT